MKHQLRFIRVLILLLSVSIFVWSILNVYSEFVRQIPRQTMEYWDCIGKVDSQKNWQHQQSIMSQLYFFSPYDAQINTDIARLNEWQAINVQAWTNTAVDAREVAIKHYSATTNLRPTWATGWLNLIKSKSLNQQFDKEVLHAFSNVFRFGQNQTGIQSEIIWLGLGMWESLDDSTKNNIRSLISNLLQAKKKEHYILITAFRFDWVEELRKLSFDPEFNQKIDYFEKNTVALERAFAPTNVKRECSL